jgi:hypothetical protein
MIKKKHLALAFIMAVGVLFLFKKDGTINYTILPKAMTPAPKAPTHRPQRVVIDRNLKVVINRVPANATYLNSPAVDWEEKLESKLKEQAGDSLKDISIVKERSLIWMRDQNPLHVEAVRISMTNQQDVKASFRALVDSQTGKVLESYDQTIFDPADVRAEYRLNLDQRNAN